MQPVNIQKMVDDIVKGVVEASTGVIGSYGISRKAHLLDPKIKTN